MGNKSKRIQGRAAILDEWGLPCGSKQVDAGYSGCKKNRHLRGGLTKMAMDAEAIKRLRRERRRARRTSVSPHEQPNGDAKTKRWWIPTIISLTAIAISLIAIGLSLGRL